MVLILLTYQISNAQVNRLLPNDTLIVTDTVIIMDVITYRKIKYTGVTTNELIAQKAALINGLESQIEAYKEKILWMDSSNNILTNELIRKDLVIANLVGLNRSYVEDTQKDIDDIKNKLTVRKPVYLKEEFYIGIAAGIIFAKILTL